MFQGADRKLPASYNAVVRDATKQTIHRSSGMALLSSCLSAFRRIWEAGVRSVKHHHKRCVGSHTLTYEEMNTVLCRTEACLNSRPIAAQSDRLKDYCALTPGHFQTERTRVVGQSVVAMADCTKNHLRFLEVVEK